MTSTLPIRTLPIRHGAGIAALAAALLSSAALTAPAFAQQNQTSLPTINVDASRLSSIDIIGASTSVITAEDIARSPGQTVQDVLATVPGVQLTSLYGGINGARTTVDLRGFGAFAAQNTLVLINGRRVNDLDIQGVDLSRIPLNSVERIEVTRGNSGAVLYGDNAVGGVINIVTKTGASGGKPMAMTIETGVGSFNQKLANFSATTNYGPWSTAAFANTIQSDGYRANNRLNQQNMTGEVRYTTPDFSAFFNLAGDNQRLGLPGYRSTKYYLDGVNQLATDPRGTVTPYDYANQQGINATTGFTKTLWTGAELIVDGGLRSKKQQANFYDDPRAPYPRYVDSTLQTWSITPRLSMKNRFFGMTSNVLTGIDYYNAGYDSDRSQWIGVAPIHAYHLNQETLAGYWQHTVGLLPSTDVSYGGRIQRTSLDARDVLNLAAPGAAPWDTAHVPLNTNETNHAWHVGIEHRFNDVFAVFGRAANAFRTPNVDERIGVGPDANGNANFNLRTQTSRDLEAGFRIRGRDFELQTSFFDMRLKNEIHFDPVSFINRNLDPTHRYGSETSATLRVNDSVRLKGGFAYTRAVFSEGQFAGNDVPLVSRLTGSAGVSWDVWQKYLTLDVGVRAWGNRRMDNDQANFQPLIPANATVDLKISGVYEQFFWSFSVNNLLDVHYYDYSVASASLANYGVFSAYPLPGRTYLLKAGMTF
ncbi:MAG: TonB-dependent receptor [Afipia sp.]|nr:TonB-dependent receptor [Afipia sp.]OJW60320.1 MAG: TonB-dependent receptor [Afipia sp. 64-13]